MSTLKELQALSDEELISKIATEVMGWKRGPHPDGITARAQWWYVDGIAIRPAYSIKREGQWNPLTDWNHWRQVEEKVMADRELLFKFFNSTAFNQSLGHYLKADLRTRCLALLAALLSIQ